MKKQQPDANTGAGHKEMCCKLTSDEFRQRKSTVLADLKKQVLGKKELENGFSYKFKGSDQMIDELIHFIKTERVCCDFFEFNLSVTGGPDMPVWLAITGKKDVKSFISQEIEL